ncbi:Uncharacterised protein [Vibrio cholerae]|nr:Uncharacterised protein [Vibrio cholerae]CSI66370.1 Uncharacterised protein [Vibrio cholerae]
MLRLLKTLRHIVKMARQRFKFIRPADRNAVIQSALL